MGLNQEVKPLIQEMDQEVLKCMLEHKNGIITCFINNHEGVKLCVDGICEHKKIGKVQRKINIDDDTNAVYLSEIDSLEVCVYVMPIMGHLIDYELFRTFLPEEDDVVQI